MKKSMLIGIRSLLPGVLIAVGPLPEALAADLHVPKDYATIQAAVDAAAAGDTIRIAAGDYYEQIVISNKTDLTLAGEPGEPRTAIHAFPGMTPRPGNITVVTVLLALRSQVVLTNLTFDGAGLADLYPNMLWGVIFAGSNVRAENCTIQGFRGATQTDTRGISVNNRLSHGTPVVNVSVRNCTFSDNIRSIVIGGDDQSPDLLRTTFAFEGDTFVGLGPATTLAHWGLMIFTGAGGDVRGNTMTGFSRDGTPGSVGAIVHQDGLFHSRGFFPVRPVRYEGNTFSNNADHLVLMAANESAVANNIFYGTGAGNSRWGGVAVSGTNIVVANNDFSGMPSGIVLLGNNDFIGTANIRPASNVSVNDNWFCNVTTPVSMREGANAIQEQGTKACEDEPFVGIFRPVFQSIVPLAGGGATLTLRAWHGDTVAIEQSTDLMEWKVWPESGSTHTMLLPTYQFKDESKAVAPHRFYRAVRD